MKLGEKNRARALRKHGLAMNEIAKRLNVSKSSVSLWVSDITLNTEQIRSLNKSPHSREAIEKRRVSRLKKENARRDKIQEQARQEVKKINRSELFVMGIALYWGEGTKCKRGVVEFTNSDPEMVKVMMKFFRKVCKVPENKFRGHVFLHEHLSVRDAERHWSNISAIPIKQFHKTSIQHNRKRIKKDTLVNGTFAIIVCDTELKLKINGWTEGVYNAIA